MTFAFCSLIYYLLIYSLTVNCFCLVTDTFVYKQQVERSRFCGGLFDKTWWRKLSFYFTMLLFIYNEPFFRFMHWFILCNRVTCLDSNSLQSWYSVMNFLAKSRASIKPSATNMISQMSSKSGTTIAHGLQRITIDQHTSRCKNIYKYIMHHTFSHCWKSTLVSQKVTTKMCSASFLYSNLMEKLYRSICK